MLRVFMRRVIEPASSAGHLSESIEVLRLVSLAASSLTCMARPPKYLDSSVNGFWLPTELLHTALAQARQEFEKEGEKIYSFRFVFRGTNPVFRINTFRNSISAWLKLTLLLLSIPPNQYLANVVKID